MTSTVIGQGQLVYVDQSKAVMAFKNTLHLNVMTNEVNLAEAADAFTYTLGYPVHVEIVDALTQVYKDYKKGLWQYDAAPSKSTATSTRANG